MTLRRQGYTRSAKVSERKAEGSVSSVMIWVVVLLTFCESGRNRSHCMRCARLMRFYGEVSLDLSSCED